MSYVVFNQNGNLLCYSSEEIKGKKNKKIPDGIDLSLYSYHGTYEEGEFLKKEDIPTNQNIKIIFESDLDYETSEKFKKYAPIHKQINSIINILIKNKDTLTTQGEDLKFLEKAYKIKKNHEENIKTYKSNDKEFKFVTRENHQNFIDEESQKMWVR